MGSKKKYKLIALVSTGAIAATSLATAVPIAVIRSQANNNQKDKQPSKPTDTKVKAAPAEAFQWDESGKIIKGFKVGATKEYIEELIDPQGRLGIPKCDEISYKAFAYAFESITKQCTICFESSIKVINESAFFGNDKIVGFKFVNSEGEVTETTLLESIGKCAFEKTGVTSIVIPDTCNEIGERAFYQCGSLAQINLTDRTKLLKNVGSHAFQGLAKAGTLTIGNKMSAETANAIAANLSTHEWGGIEFGTSGWVIQRKDGTSVVSTKTIPTIYLNITDELKLKSGIKTGKLSDYNALYIPSEVKEIDQSAFAENENLTVLSFEANSQCAIIGELAFYDCTNLCTGNTDQALVMPEALTTIGRHSFTRCANVKKLDFSKIVYDNRTRTFAVGTEAFNGWWVDGSKNPNKIAWPSVPSGADEETALEKVKSMFKFALSTTGKLNDTWVRLDDKEVTNVKNRMGTSITPVVGDEKYEYRLVSFNWDGVEEEGFNTLKIPKGISVIDSTAFWDEETHTTKIPDTIKTIDMSNSEIKEIGANAFRQSNIQTVIFSDATEKIGEGAFQDCKKLNGVSLPASLQSIGANAFKGCDNAYYLDLSKLTNEQLKEIIRKQNEGEKVIGDNAFQDFGILQEAGGTIIWPADATEEVKNGIINILCGTGLPESWVKEDTGKTGYTGGIPEKYNGNVILEIEHDEVADKYTLKSINWSALEDYVSDVEEKTGVEVTSLPLVVPAHVSDIAADFWGSPTSSKVSIVDKLYFANNSKCKTIGAHAFENATNFTGDLNIPNGVETIGASAFSGCTGFDGTLTLPKSLSTNPCGVDTTSFANVTKFTTLNISSWDISYINTWDSQLSNYPLAANSLVQFSEDTFVQTNDGIDATAQAKLKEALVYAGLGSEVLGENVSSYTSKYEPITLTLEDDEKVIDTKAKKQIVAEKYIDIIKDGAEGHTGEEILTNDLMLTFKNAAVNSPALASTSPSINVRISNVNVEGRSISFDIVGNINVYSDTYRYGYVSQFATQVKNLLITSADQLPSYDIKQTDKQIGIVFTTDESTVFTSSYDKQYLYGYTDDGAYFKKNAIDVTNKTFDFVNLDGKFLPNTPYEGKDPATADLYEASRQAYLSAPSLFGLMFGAYDYSLIYNLNNGCDANGYLYSPYIKTSVTGEGEQSQMTMTYTPLTGMLASNSLSNYNVYGEKQTTDGTVWTTNMINFNNTQPEATAESISTKEASLAAYKTFLTTESTGYSKANGQRFKEDVLYGFIEPIKQQIQTIAADYKFLEESTVDFTKLNGLDVITTDADGNVYANFGLNIKVYLHDSSFVKNSVDQEGNTVSSYKHSYELYIPLEFRNINLNAAYKAKDASHGVNWSIFDNATASKQSSMTLGVTKNSMGPYVQEMTYNEETHKFDRKLTFEPNPGKYESNDIYNDIKNMTTTEQIDTYMKQKWPLLTVLNILHSDNDGSKLHISFGYTCKYLNKATW